MATLGCTSDHTVDLKAFCRICLAKSNSCMPQIPLSAQIIQYTDSLENTDKPRISGCQALEDIVGEEIENVNDYACGICSVCLVQLESAYDLKRQYFKSKVILEKAFKERDYSDLPNENIVDVDLTNLLNEVIIEESENGQDVETQKKPYFLRKSIRKTYQTDDISDPEDSIQNNSRKIKLVQKSRVHSAQKTAENEESLQLKPKIKKENVEEKLPSVELVSGPVSYDIKDVILIEKPQEEYENQFQGFLHNLKCNSLTASYVKNQLASKKPTITDSNVKPIKSEIEITALSEKAVEEMENLAPIKALASEPKKMSFLCRHCNETFQSSSYIKRHMPICAKFQNLECYLCEKKQPTMRALVAHVKQHHKPKKNRKFLGGPASCKICFKVIANRNNLAYHMLAHRDKRFACEECGSLFLTLSALRGHVNSKHKKNTIEVCPICAKTFTYKNGVHSHMRIHTEEFKYECQYCAKKFRHLYTKKTHELRHTGEKPLKCQFCEKRFRKHHERLKHERRAHTGERPFECKVCSKAYITGELLHRHMIQHEGPFKCLDCRKGFVNTKILKFHLKQAHNITEITDPIRMSQMMSQ